MKTLKQQLTNYALYHRSKRNIYTHFIGIPLIVFAIICLLQRVTLISEPAVISLATVVIALTCLYYLMLSLSMGLIMAVCLSLLSIAAEPVVSLSTELWLAVSIGSFVVGWVFQFIGHYFEGKKPAFVDDLMGLVIGPLFVLAEFLIMLGFYKDIANHIEQHAGPNKA
ncbi:Mpo1 family 2-hydroxy fatty acid dioxygenase [Pseudoalteromonas shioyasakiensis]|uniref:Mpo1 family 2-hydroxy fatty acid dioxygenase n=1 Tax=Pseudoalteromonas shioyasakiensis TaxID=1190813 RepID=UPI001C3E6CA0|nr:Mpo1-like protein [Pseudoalteromonas shioyasakiensis]